MRQARQQGGGQARRVQVRQVLGGLGAQGVTEAYVRQHDLADVGASQGIGEDVGEQVDQVEHLDAVAAQRFGEGVVLLLRAADPRNSVEEQRIVVARGQAREFRAGTVQQDRRQLADLVVNMVVHVTEPMPAGA